MAIAIFSTWTTYGTWLPGDERGWFDRDTGLKSPDFMRKLEAEFRLEEHAVLLDLEQRRIVEKTIVDHCAIRGWILHAVNCRSNHVHVVVTATNRPIELPREQFKSWCTRKLKENAKNRGLELSLIRQNWWTERGWDVFIDDEKHLFDAISYVRDGQDLPR